MVTRTPLLAGRAHSSWVVALASTAAVLALSACGGTDSASQPSQADQTAAAAADTAEEALAAAERALAAVERIEAELAAGADELAGGADGLAADDPAAAADGLAGDDPAAGADGLAMTDEGAPADAMTDEEVASDEEAASEEVHWSYEGDTGPDRWAEVSEEFALCESGLAQSPIDVTTAGAAAVGLDDLALTWGPSDVSIVDNGHTVQADLAAGNRTVIDGQTYELVQFHFHKPSEHTVDTEAFPMELHFVHAADDGRLAVVGVLLTEGEANPAFDGLFTDGTELTGFDPASLLPTGLGRYRYGGSLTTPPCSEGVNWNVLVEPVALSADQIAGFVHDGNARPVQPLNGRPVLSDTTAPAGS